MTHVVGLADLSDTGESTTQIATRAVLTRTSMLSHVGRICRGYGLQFAVTFFAMLGAAWLILEFGAYLQVWSFQGLPLLLGTCVVSAIMSAGWVVRKYLLGCPPGFENESRDAQRLAQICPARWEASLAKALLLSRIRPLDDEYQRLSSNEIYVPIQKRYLDPFEYHQWISARISGAQALLKPFMSIAVRQFGEAVLSTDEQLTTPDRIRSAVDRVADYYAQTVEYEKEGRSVIPPDGFERLHQLHFGWSEVLRDGISSLTAFLDQVIKVDIKSPHPNVCFNIVLDSPPRIDEFTNELARLEAELSYR